MKIFIAFVFFIFITAPSKLSAQEVEVIVEVKGLACPFCAARLESSFIDIEGIGEVKIELEAGLLSFVMNNDNKLTKKQIKKKIKKSGFTPGKVLFRIIEPE